MLQDLDKQLYGKVGNVSIYLISGFYFRNEFDTDFLNFGHSETFESIPENEVYVDNIYGAYETEIFAKRGVEEYRLMSHSVAYDDAIDMLRSEEKQVRDESKGFVGVEKTLYKEFGEVKVYLVDGLAVRTLHDVDFLLGGHGLIYGFIPQKEIWLDLYIEPYEQDADLVHEYSEWTMMAYMEMSYDNAHDLASKIERIFRDNLKKSLTTTV